MKTFNYHSAKDVKEASKLASSNSVFLAGGMTTIPSMKLGLASYKDIIDIKKISKLSGIKVSGKTIKIGATTRHVEFAIPQKSSYQKLPNPASRYAIVGVYVAKYKTGINVAVTGAKSCVYNDKELANALSKNFSPSVIENVKISSSKMNSDIHASSEYRANMVKVFAKKAVEAC